MASLVCADDRFLHNGASDESVLSDMAAAVRVLLQGLGEDLHQDGLVNTPLRVARAFLSAMRGYGMSAKDVIGDALFHEPGPEDPNGFGGGSGGMVVVRNIDLFATCRSCLLPFKIRTHIAYIPSGGKIVGLSKISRLAEIYSKRLQTPREFADGVAEALEDALKPLGVAVVAESWHLQWPLVPSGAFSGNGATKVFPQNEVAWVPNFQAYAGKGSFYDKSYALWEELIALLQSDGTTFHLPDLMESLEDATTVESCPFLSKDWKTSNGFDSCFSPTQCNGMKPFSDGGRKKVVEDLVKADNAYDRIVESIPAMIAAVESLLYAVGQDPKSQELEHTSRRYVLWLLASTQGAKIHSYLHSKNQNNSNCVAISALSMACAGDQLDMHIASELRFPFCSLCEHHLLPFSGMVHVGYFCNPKTPSIERSLLLKVIQLYSRRLQVQERLTRQIAEAVLSNSSYGVMVVVEASHLCMVSRGVKTIGSSTTTAATLGRFATDAASRAAFLRKISKVKADSSAKSWL